LGRGPGGALRRALDVARSRRPAAHRRGGEHGDRAGRQCHRAAAALGGRAAGPVAGRARRLPGAAAAGERRLRGHDSASRRLGERPGPRADAAGAGRLARGCRVSRLLRRSLLYTSVAAALAACLFQAAPATPQVAKDSAAAGPAAPRSAPVHDSVLEQRVARLELLVAERDAQVEDLEARLDEARQEVVRALAKLQTVASRAEAASAIAEAEIAVQALRAATGTQPGGGADVAQAGTLLQQASGEFAKQNYGGALYLANQTKSLTNASRSRLGGAGCGRDRAPRTRCCSPWSLALASSAIPMSSDGYASAMKAAAPGGCS